MSDKVHSKRKANRRLLSSVHAVAVAAAAVVAALAGPTRAADRFWVGTSGGDWYDQSNWSATFPPPPNAPPASVPGIGDVARFQIGGISYTVTYTDVVDVNSLFVPNDVVALDLLGRQLITSQVVHVGTVFNDIGGLTLRNGIVTSPVVLVGFNNGDGRLLVEDDAVLNVEGSLNPLDATLAVGGNPNGTDGVGQMDIFGTLNAHDTDSVVGGRLRGIGTATVDGGTWLTDGSLFIGRDGAEGLVSIHNGGSVSTGAQTYVGESGRTNEFVDVTGRGELSITNGTMTTTATATIGSSDNSFGEADLVGPNSRWDIHGFLFVAEFGIGNMHVRNGAQVHVQNDSFISVGTNEGLLNVTGFGSLLNDGNLYVGGSSSSAGGPGHLLVQSNGEVEVGECLKVWETGTLTVDDGTITTGCLEIRPGATVNFESGSLVINGGPLNIPLNLELGGSDPFNPPQIILLDGAIASVTDFSLGASPGTSSAFALDHSTINVANDINLGGNDAQALGRGALSITSGVANAGGVLRVWNESELNVDSGRVTSAEAQITGGRLSIGGTDPAMYVDASGDLPTGLAGIHVGFAPPRTELTVNQGASLIAPDVDFSVGTDTSSLAFATVSGPGSTMLVRDGGVGALGDGTLNVLDAANVSFAGDLSIGQAPNSFGNLLIDGAGSAVTCQGTTTVGRQGLGSLHLTAGSSFHSLVDTRIGALAAFVNPAPGFVIIDGGTWNNDGSIYLGGDEFGAQDGGGQIFLKTDGTIRNQGTLQVWSTGTLSLEGGSLHTRDLLFEDGAGLDLFAGSITVSGGQFRPPSPVTSFGGPDAATPVAFSFLDGASAQTPLSWYIGNGQGLHGSTIVSGVSPDGVRSTLRGTANEDSADLVVGSKGTGTMRVLDGALADFGDDVFIGFQNDAVGVLEVGGVADGFGATVQATRGGADAAITVGGRNGATGGRGKLEVFDGGLVETSGDMFIARTAQSRGNVYFFGRKGLVGEIRVADDLFLAGTESGPGGHGEIELGGGGLLVVGDVFKVWPDSFFVLDGGTIRTNHLDLTDAGPGSFLFHFGRVEANQITGDFENFSGTLAHGPIVGSMTLDGDYTQFGGATFEFELVELNLAAVEDTLHITGTATLDGTLRVEVHPEFRPAVGERFTVMTFASRSGEFDSVVSTGLALFDIVYHDTSIEIVVVDSPLGPGDLDHNGVVNLGDYALLHDCITGPQVADPLAFPCDATDLNDDARVDLRDVSLWEQQRSFPGVPGVARWTAPTSGQWKDNPNWRNGTLPIPGDQVFIDVPGAVETVTLDHDASFDGPVESLLCNEKLRVDFSSLSVNGPFRMNNTLELACGKILDSTIDLGIGGLVNVAGGPCASVLDGVTINGNMDVLVQSQGLKIRNGLTINGAIRIGGFTGSAATGLYFEDANMVLDGNSVISFISNPSSSGIVQRHNGDLHIKSGITIRGAEGIVGRSDQLLTQDGVIDSDAAGLLHVRGLGWQNNGALRTSGDASELWVGDSWTNHGTIDATNSARLILGEPGSGFQNLGTITATNADVRLNGDFTIADLGTFDFVNSTVAIEGTLINDAGLVLDSGKFNWDLGRGTVLGGTISSADGTTFDPVPGICCGDPTLDGVTLDANMRMNRNTGIVIKNGLTLNGVISMNAFQSLGARLRLDGPDRTIDGTGRIEFLSTGGNNIYQGGSDSPAIITIGPDITISGAHGTVGTHGGNSALSVVNEGTIHSDKSGEITIHGSNATNVNNGVLRSSGAGLLQVSGPWTNNGTVHAAGGWFLTRATWTNHGTVRLEAAKALDSEADFVQSSTGTFLPVIRSTASNGFGKMIVSGAATLDGVLRVEFEDTYTPAAGHSFAVLQYGSRIGEFASIEAPGLDPGLEVVPTYHDTFLDIVIQQR